MPSPRLRPANARQASLRCTTRCFALPSRPLAVAPGHGRRDRAGQSALQHPLNLGSPLPRRGPQPPFPLPRLEALRATLARPQGDVEGAMNMHTRAHLRDPRFDGVKAERLKATKTMKHLERAREAARDKKWAEAKRELVGVRAEVKSSTEVDILEAEALLGLGKVDEAMALITDVVRTGEGRRSNRALTVRANCLYLQGNLPQAQRHLSEVMKMDPDNTAAGQLLKAIRKQEALKAEGNEAFRTGNNEAAVTAYTACIDLGPESKLFLSTVFANRAAARMRLRQWELASADCDACLDLNDQYIKGYLRRAECAQKIGGKEALERALRDLNAAKDLAPDSDTLRSINRE